MSKINFESKWHTRFFIFSVSIFVIIMIISNAVCACILVCNGMDGGENSLVKIICGSIMLPVSLTVLAVLTGFWLKLMYAKKSASDVDMVVGEIEEIFKTK